MGEGGGQKYPKNDPHGLQMSPRAKNGGNNENCCTWALTQQY